MRRHYARRIGGAPVDSGSRDKVASSEPRSPRRSQRKPFSACFASSAVRVPLESVTALLHATSITKSFAGLQALRDVSFELAPGEVHALVGENGAGKSTLIKIIAGAERPDSGTLTLAGRTVQAL